MPAFSLETRLWLGGLASFLGFALLGLYVSGRTPTTLDVEAVALRGQATALAAFFTALGRWYAILALSGLGIAVSFALRSNPLPFGVLLVSQSVSQAVIAALKTAFGRPRPDAWLLFKERDLSYPSGHAATTVIFYFSLLLLVLRAPGSSRALQLAVASCLAVCLVGIPWSRLALGAHYATDVLGGLLFGVGWVCVVSALLHRFVT